MRVMLTAVLVFASLSSTAPLSAQQSTPAPATSDPQAVALIQRALAALVGRGTVSDVTLTGTARRIAGSDDETGTATLKALPNGSSRVDFIFPSGNRSEIRNPSGVPLADILPQNLPVASTTVESPQPVGAWSGPDGILHGVPTHNLMTDSTWFFPAFTLANYLSPEGPILSYFGAETHEGQPTLHVQVSQPLPASFDAPLRLAVLAQHLSQMDLYVDPGTLMPIALAFYTHPNNNAFADATIEIRFSDYQVVNGVLVPSHVQKYLNNGLVLDLQFSSTTLNSGIAATVFQIQ